MEAPDSMQSIQMAVWVPEVLVRPKKVAGGALTQHEPSLPSMKSKEQTDA
jgi:hypothetical protein